MIRFTSSGVVAAPQGLQVRLSHDVGTSVRAGAPAPSRDLRPDEVEANLKHFTVDRSGPRARPIERLVLSGLSAINVSAMLPLMAGARRWGVRHISAHLTGSQVVHAPLDACTRRLDGLEALKSLAQQLGHRTGVLLLNAGELGQVETLVHAIAPDDVDRIVLSWPFPPSGSPASIHEILPWLSRVATRLDSQNIPWSLKGLPGCLVGPHAHRIHRTANRWYVDADHQRHEAILFLPGVLRFYKPDSCRTCVLDRTCDGAADEWVRAERVPRLEPVESLQDRFALDVTQGTS